MDDLSQRIQQVLSDPQAMSQLQGMLGALGAQSGPAVQPSAPLPQPAGDLSSLGHLLPLLQQQAAEDDSSRLLSALRPLLSPARQQKLDEASRLLRILRLLPLLREGLGGEQGAR